MSVTVPMIIFLVFVLFVFFVFVLVFVVMACLGGAAGIEQTDESQARRRAADVPLFLNLHLVEVHGQHVTTVRIGDVHHFADNDERRTSSLSWRDQLHRRQDVAVMGIECVQDAVDAEYVQCLAVAGERRRDARLVEHLLHLAVVHVNQPDAVVGERLTVEVGGFAEEVLNLMVSVD